MEKKSKEVYVKFTPDAGKGSNSGLYLYKDHPNYSEPLFSSHLKKLTHPTVTEEEIKRLKERFFSEDDIRKIQDAAYEAGFNAGRFDDN